jgi:hypothetical protein
VLVAPVSDSKHLDAAADTLARITGQHPVTTLARKSIASFKLREGNKVGTTVTLRGERAEEFLDQLVSIVLPASATSAALATTPSIRLAITASAFQTTRFSRSSTSEDRPAWLAGQYRYHGAKMPPEGKRLLEN